MKNFEREKNERSRGVHVDIPREEDDMLCEENGISSTYGKVCNEKSSLDKINPKVIETTFSIEQVYVDENDKGKENYFGSVQDKAHNKKFNKAIADLTPMRKEKHGDIIPLLPKTKYDMYN
ncbi:hypothetical protein KY284_001093 [Solanum tuberosum]|nr:hypothetical protein KY284_001093 [Solanum tuberosum]